MDSVRYAVLLVGRVLADCRILKKYFLFSGLYVMRTRCFVTVRGQCTLCDPVGWPSFVDCRILQQQQQQQQNVLGVFGVWREKTKTWGKRQGMWTVDTIDRPIGSVLFN